MAHPADQLVHRLRPAAGAARGALVLLHGRGTDENDLMALLDVLDPQHQLVGVTPRAPLQLPPGGHHWYRVARVGYPDPATFYATLLTLSAWLDQLPGLLGVPWPRTVLGGFSLGAVMAYTTGLARGRPRPAGIMALSGFIPTVEGLALDLESSRGLPVAIAHGSADPVIEVGFGRDARDRLSAAGLDVEYHEAPVAHHIDPRTLPELTVWLGRVLAGAGA
ncbi:MAG TPA: phospholipase [Solirubrobacteraceae bacterium]|nr:phospholipase [Solirubrobacteraceae bacterium]